MPAADLAARVIRLTKISSSALADLLTDGTAEWGPHEENTALLLEAESYKLQLSWVDRTTDPDDPAVKRERAQAKRAGIKPPEHPMIPPVAHRPRALAAQKLQEYLRDVAQYQVQNKSPGTHMVTPAEFDAAIGIVPKLA